MNDRFKFRYYDLNTMYNVKMLDIAENEVYITLDESNYGFSMFLIKKEDFNENKLMQCTGLKDKNGNLIYEGDIVQISNGSLNGSVLKKTRVVEWKTNKWNIPEWIIDKPDFSHYIEVIGNIYENPELLENKNE